MTDDAFDATFRLHLDADTVWTRLAGDAAPGEHIWLAGFDSSATVDEVDESSKRLRVTKDAEPCAGSDIVVVLEHEADGTRIRVVQSRFGGWLAGGQEAMSVGWRFIVADLQTYLATGVHARRHLRPWGDLGATVASIDGGVRLDQIRTGGVAAHLGLTDGDLLVSLAGAPTASLDDVVTILRVIDGAHIASSSIDAEWIRDGTLMSTR